MMGLSKTSLFKGSFMMTFSRQTSQIIFLRLNEIYLHKNMRYINRKKHKITMIVEKLKNMILADETYSSFDRSLALKPLNPLIARSTYSWITN